MKRSLTLLVLLSLLTVLAIAVFATPDPVSREVAADFIIEPVQITQDFDFWSMFEGASWYQKILLYLPFFTAVLFVLDKIVKWTPNKYDDVIVAFFKTIITAMADRKRGKSYRG